MFETSNPMVEVKIYVRKHLMDCSFFEFRFQRVSGEEEKRNLWAFCYILVELQNTILTD